MLNAIIKPGKYPGAKVRSFAVDPQSALRLVGFEKIGKSLDKILVFEKTQYRGCIIAFGGLRLGVRYSK